MQAQKKEGRNKRMNGLIREEKRIIIKMLGTKKAKDGPE